jgi:hypothetical protein
MSCLRLENNLLSDKLGKEFLKQKELLQTIKEEEVIRM